MIPELGDAALFVALALSAYGAIIATRSAGSADLCWLASACHTALAQFVLVTAAGRTP